MRQHWQRRRCYVASLVGSRDLGLPSKRTLVLALISFILSLLIGTVCAVQKSPPDVLLAISSLLAVAVALLCFADWLRRRRIVAHNKESVPLPIYARNLGNTVATSIITLLAIPLLYRYVWYPGLNQDVTTFEMDTVDQMYFPSITLFQRVDWSSQAILTVHNKPKCFIGWADEGAPDCALSNSQNRSCRCADRWEHTIRNYTWRGIEYRTLSFLSSEAELCTVPTTLMLAQAFFWYDAQKALDDSSRILSPSLWVAVYDPTLTLTDALENDYTRLTMVDADGMVAISLGLNYRQARGKSPAYDYDLTLSTIPRRQARVVMSGPIILPRQGRASYLSG
ncbi:hypothetical protein GGR52DRAFT_566993 [Hypoxylon sp. FL1284]|nr:hypothetical protein GGR52DRAFT_566993 [Hypoxylon sp. FL1284]